MSDQRYLDTFKNAGQAFKYSRIVINVSEIIIKLEHGYTKI